MATSSRLGDGCGRRRRRVLGAGTSLVGVVVALGHSSTRRGLAGGLAWVSSAARASRPRLDLGQSAADRELHLLAAPELGPVGSSSASSAGALLTGSWAACTAVALWSARRDRSRRPAAPRGVARGAAGASEETATEVDVAIIGSGPAGTMLAYLLAERHGRSVCLIDPGASKPWRNNYGVWQEEWDALSAKLELPLNSGLDTQWDFTDVWFGGSWEVPVDSCIRLDRKYARVQRAKLKELLTSSKVQLFEEALDVQAIATNIFDGPGLRHDASGSTITLPSGKVIRSKLVVDTSGSESRLTRRMPGAGESPAPAPGYQIAYGFEVVVDGSIHYAPDAMTLFDYRTDHLSHDPEWERRAVESPTFMYAMPLGPAPGGSGSASQRVFFEETSLVARPAMSFEECKKRAFARLKHLGVAYRPETITDEEFCYIPMGGDLPEPRQRVAAFGGAAAMVHPSTGYTLCRMLAASKDMADAIGKELAADSRPDAVAAAAYAAIWSQENQAQRAFAVFGGEFLMQLNVEGLRGWFSGFFDLPESLWSGFLAGWPGLPGNSLHESWFARIWFGGQLLVKLPPPLALKLLGGIASFTLKYGTSLLRSVTPLFGAPPSYEWIPPVPKAEIGDVAAKREFVQLSGRKLPGSTSESRPS
ncbi:unnamed protein product [Polarella glacialis]|uniref:lycopene beta-cyclase n=1 Tax=Polarella glacialis TaxID=89957 RepID=A0A813I7C1_POLGL|nr:unnamed protein product [Polarella glacialis]